MTTLLQNGLALSEPWEKSPGAEERNRNAMVRFGDFAFDPQSGDLFRAGHRLHLTNQLCCMLEVFLKEPGQVISKEELGAALWPAKTGRDLERSIFTAVKRLRTVLGDDISRPRYIETRSRRGYVFLLPPASDATENPGTLASSSDTKETRSASGLRVRAVVLLVILAIGMGLLAAVWVNRAFPLQATSAFHSSRIYDSFNFFNDASNGARPTPFSVMIAVM